MRRIWDFITGKNRYAYNAYGRYYKFMDRRSDDSR